MSDRSAILMNFDYFLLMISVKKNKKNSNFSKIRWEKSIINKKNISIIFSSHCEGEKTIIKGEKKG